MTTRRQRSRGFRIQVWAPAVRFEHRFVKLDKLPHAHCKHVLLARHACFDLFGVQASGFRLGLRMRSLGFEGIAWFIALGNTFTQKCASVAGFRLAP